MKLGEGGWGVRAVLLLLRPRSSPRLSPDARLRLVPAMTELGLWAADRKGVAFLVMVRVAITHG